MSSAPVHPTPGPATTERRSRPRKRLDQLAYIGFGPDIGGVLLDVSEEGLRCQIVGSVAEGDRCHLKFALPGRPAAIEADGEVVWSNSSKQGGGLRLVGLPPEVRQNLQQWIQEELASGGVSKPSAPRIRTKSVATAPVAKPSTPAAAAPAPAATEPAASQSHWLRSRVQITRHAGGAQATPFQPMGRHLTMPLTLPCVEQGPSLVTKLTILAACIVAAALAIAYSGLSPALILSEARISGDIVAGIVVSPPRMPLARPDQAVTAKPVENTTPDSTTEMSVPDYESDEFE